MEKSIHLNLLSIIDYNYMRDNRVDSNVAFQNVKHLNLECGNTFWQELSALDVNYIPEYEPSLTTLERFKLVHIQKD